MSYNDSYDQGPRRSSRRAPREPAGPAKVQGSTAAAILVFVAIVGLGIGALIGNAGGDDNPDTTETDSGTASDPVDENTDEQPDESDDGSESENGDENGDQEPSGGEGITLTSGQDGGEVAAGESGTIEVQAALESGEGDVTLRVQRSLDGGQTWDDFCDACTDETSGSGTYSTNFWSSRTGENKFRVVGPDDLASNAITVTVVEGDDEDED